MLAVRLQKGAYHGTVRDETEICDDEGADVDRRSTTLSSINSRLLPMNEDNPRFRPKDNRACERIEGDSVARVILRQCKEDDGAV